MVDYNLIKYNSENGLWVVCGVYFHKQSEACKYLDKFEKRNIKLERKRKIEKIFGKSCK